ncbi:hypothetical protein A3Q56_00885 [Intoshia linei]|uniref:TIP41-like protein n=1 Tax=Intoshia linei TaxID=1819745 RepID=A0A177BCR4_9BILA|nr:hypothetical protein A3Q56_00885 [Intoshia linei]
MDRNVFVISKAWSVQTTKGVMANSSTRDMFQDKLQMTHLPDMLFDCNSLTLKHVSGCTLSFNVMDALSLVPDTIEHKVAVANKWKTLEEIKNVSLSNTVNYDWTFSSKFNGTLLNGEIHQFERVMPTFAFILLRHYLRVDGVVAAIADNRFIIQKNDDYILREYSYRKLDFASISLPISTIKNATILYQKLEPTNVNIEKLKIKENIN